MTSEQWDAMSPDEQRVKVLELCGWSHTTNSCGTFWWNDEVNKTLPPEDDGFRERPDCLNDLNAMHEAEKMLKGDDRLEYIDYLTPMSNNDFERRTGCFATAAQRAKAFVLTMEGE